jgi:hypothetical protein
MLNLLKKSAADCGRFREELEVSAGAATGVESSEDLLDLLPAAQRAHGVRCAKCGVAVAEYLIVRRLMRQIAARSEAAGGPWFAGRVMAVIAGREAELNGPAGTWIALPKLASRLALAACAVLLVGSTWLYQRPRTAQVNEATASTSSGSEYLFEAPPPMTPDDVLMSLAENNK